MKFDLFERIFDNYLGNGISGVLRQFPKNWKSYNQYVKRFEKVMKGKVKEQEKRKKKGKKPMTKAEWRKGVPVFKSLLKESDVRIVVVGNKCWTRLFVAKNLTTKIFQKIIKDYKI